MPKMINKKAKTIEIIFLVFPFNDRSKSCEKANNIIEKYIEYSTSLK